jgi:hypothetical protein
MRPEIKKAMALLVYNRHMNGSHVPGTTDNTITGELGNLEEFLVSTEARQKAFFKEVRYATLHKYIMAINIVDNGGWNAFRIR